MENSGILVIEDDDGIRETLKEVLESEGYQVSTATNGQEGLDILRQSKPPRVILLDLMMPVMNGWEFLQVQSQDEKLSSIPVVVISAAGDRAKLPGQNEFIKKPIELEALIDVVKKHCAAAMNG